MTLFRSFCNIPVVAARNDVIAPAKVITIKAVGGYSNKGEHLAIMKTPAVTISRDYYNLPPQNNPEEYEGLVRDQLDQALNVLHYRNILVMEYFELTVLERKGLLGRRTTSLRVRWNWWALCNIPFSGISWMGV
ncbi:hypothetical protein Tco_1464747 [Tanacetum coccineum]